MTSLVRKSVGLSAFLLLSFVAALPDAHPTSSRPRIDTEAWDIKEASPSDSNSELKILFRLNFGQTHQRVFFATITPGKGAAGVLTQESRTGHTAASINSAKGKILTKLLADFTASTDYAKPGKYWSCQYPLDFTFAQKTTLRRCREMLTPAHKKEFAKLVNKLSFESKR